jgi:hypothetical protein
MNMHGNPFNRLIRIGYWVTMHGSEHPENYYLQAKIKQRQEVVLMYLRPGTTQENQRANASWHLRSSGCRNTLNEVLGLLG